MNFFLRIHQLSMKFDDLITEWGGSVMGLLLRLYVGVPFLISGWSKLRDWDGALFLFREEYSVPVLPPELAALMGTGGELGFSLLLLCGLFTRPAALGLFAVNAMAVISYPLLRTFECPAAINDHLYWGILLLVLTVYGGGKFSQDNLIAKKFSQTH
jgi:putative oxidoreductase